MRRDADREVKRGAFEQSIRALRGISLIKLSLWSWNLVKAMEETITADNNTFNEEISTVQPLLQRIYDKSHVIQDIQELESQASEARTQAATDFDETEQRC